MLPLAQEQIQRQPSESSSISYSDLLPETIDELIECYDEASNDNVLGKRKSTQEVGSPLGSPPYKRPRGSESSNESFASRLFEDTGSSSSATSAPTSQEDSDLLKDAYIIAQPDLPLLARLRNLPWGVQWEICRLVAVEAKFSWSRVDEILDDLRGNHRDLAPHVENILATGEVGAMQRTRELSARAPWDELDWEAVALNVKDCACMGHMNSAEGLAGVVPEDWYGGQVQFAAKLVLVANSEPPRFQISLLSPELASSSRFTRRFGSDFLIRVRIHKDVFRRAEYGGHLENFLLRPFVLSGRVYRFFYANKERTAFLMATNETYPHGLYAPELARRRSFLGFMEWHNPMAKNNGQTMAKYCSRTALGLSNSVPGGVFDAPEIYNVPDIYSEALSGDGKSPSAMEMTDGCGFVNLAVGHCLRAKGICKDPPTAIQMRLRGAKGLLLRHWDPEKNKSETFSAWLRPSQDKIRYTPKHLFDIAHRSLDLLRVSHMRSPIPVSKEIIINLAENGVHHTTFEKLMKMQLKEAIAGLVDWSGEDAMYRLWVAVEKEGHVITARMARENSGTARVRGLRAYDKEEENCSDEEDDDEGDTSGIMADVQRERSAAWWGDEISGCPSSLEETVMVFLDSGFRPDTNPVLAGKLHEVIKKAVKSHVSKYRLYVPMSCSAFIVPDPCGALEEGEIHVKSSSRNLLLPDGRMSDKIVGDVLVTRNPCKLPTDVQKVKAVFKAELDDYVDVIVFSTKGSRSLASLLGGGDYDGDKADVIWQPEIVKTFMNADRKFADPPSDLRMSFREENKRVTDFMKEIPSTASPLKRTQALQRFLLAPLRDTHAVGTYSAMHDNAMYLFGYDHPETIRLAWMFCTVLDGTKTGLTVEPSTFSKDKKDYNASQMPYWKRGVDSTGKSSDTHVQRPKGLRAFVMDYIQTTMKNAKDEQLAIVETRFKHLPKPEIDEDLLKPYKEALALAGAKGPKREEYNTIERHVDEMYRLHKQEMATFASRFGKNFFTELSIEKRQDVIRSLSRRFTEFPAPGTVKHWTKRDVRFIRASLAYQIAWAKSSGKVERFPWDVAMRDLCDIKLEESPHKSVNMAFYDRFRISRQGFTSTS